MATWQRILVTALIGASCAYACKVTTSDDDNDDVSFDDNDDDDDDDDDAQPTAGTAGRGGSGATAGSGGRAGSSSTGGTAGTVSTAGRGGSSGSGGSNAGTGGIDDGIPDDLMCGQSGTEPAELCEFQPAANDRYASCLTCLSGSCCEEVKDCYSTDPTDACGYGPDGSTEYTCYIECLVKAANDSGIGAYDPAEDPQTCFFECGAPKDGKGRACSTPLIADSTHVLVECMHTNCEIDCIDELLDD